MKRPVLVLLLLLAAIGGAALLYFEQRDRGHDSARAAPSAGPSAAMRGAMDHMHEAMAKAPITGDIDRDFVALMVPHHQSAVDMARVYLEHGKDPALRRLSENIIVSQEAEIRQMRGGAPAPEPGSSTAVEASPHAGH